MTLSERLEQARQERREAERRARGIPLPGLLPEPKKVDVVEEPAEDPLFVDLTRQPALAPPEPELLAVATTAGLRSVAPPPPSADGVERCPTCSRPARVDMADLVSHITQYGCDTCGTLWQRSEL